MADGMVTGRRLIDANALAEQVDNLCADWNENWIGNDNQSFILHSDVSDLISDAPTVDAVEVGEILLHHILIDESGIPEVKLQFGERVLVLRNEDEPVNVREVVHGRLGVSYMDEYYGEFADCLECGTDNILPCRYCRNCGARMDGDNHEDP